MYFSIFEKFIYMIFLTLEEYKIPKKNSNISKDENTLNFNQKKVNVSFDPRQKMQCNKEMEQDS